MLTAYSSKVQNWLLLGLFMLIVQVLLGGITRLTDSGLSITEWKVILGVLPPLSQEDWMVAFEQYQKVAYKQFQAIHSDMTLGEFKVIFFWEWFHRLWARIMGFVFIIPFCIFLYKKQIDKVLVKKLVYVILGAALAAVFGWIMVASGLNTDHFAWVNAYKLSIHLSIAFITFLLLLNAYLYTLGKCVDVNKSRLYLPLFILVSLQIVFGAWMSGMKAGLLYPQFPDMGGSYLPAVLLDSNNWTLDNLAFYNNHIFAPTLVQFLHRFTALLLTIIMLVFGVKYFKSFTRLDYTLVAIFVLQVLLGIFTLINCIGTIPVTLGVLHQIVALFLLSNIFIILYYKSKCN